MFRFPHDHRPNRVLLHDTDAVMYDAWWPHLDNWGLADLRAIKSRRINYYVTTVATVLAKAVCLRLDSLSAEERSLHRPDLPFVALHDTTLAWTESARRFATDEPPLHASHIYLLPFGPDGGTKAGRRVEADNGSYFTSAELFRKAQAIQTEHVSRVMPTAGVGIYRSGLWRGLPTFYLWGSVSRLHPRPGSDRC